ncbi:PadR family transcriptional regulator [Nonomuraea muscovyensis]|uniref:DNA-binding PadR family transcriptional regulator n=1 Tax=Nonomuraea muscovyensis TaxID=1124761 RepID=A0A7X0F122_9ACTN|nr:PadR family transcriptional regulator [Nonomuraea muscovyensis]MBB6348261.1 DNA-binding PadR family transcriptional regulator [Nonomuraea muscovyensis]MDF2709595.1 PadR family transcriptional regulator [Nonomuraea muscovyensis]
MTKRRKVGNLLALAVLSALVQRPMHPYEMASVLRARGKDRDMAVKWGSLYTVVHNLDKHGLIEAAQSSREGGRPERTVYRVTDAGRAELEDWTRELLSTPEEEHPRFEAGLSVMAGLAPDEVTTLLRRRLEALETRIAAQRAALDRERAQIPRLFLVESEYALAMREAEAAWTRSLLDELAAGTFPGLEQWRAYHRTGRLAPDVAGLAERGSVTD